MLGVCLLFVGIVLINNGMCSLYNVEDISVIYETQGSFPGAVNIPLDEFEERMESVDREKMVYVLCHTGDRSRDCVEKLSDAGYEAVNIEGGYRAYLRLSLSRFMEEYSAMYFLILQ